MSVENDTGKFSDEYWRLSSRSSHRGCCVEWSSSFEVSDGPAKEMIALIKGVYDAGMGVLRQTFKS